MAKCLVIKVEKRGEVPAPSTTLATFNISGKGSRESGSPIGRAMAEILLTISRVLADDKEREIEEIVIIGL